MRKMLKNFRCGIVVVMLIVVSLTAPSLAIAGTNVLHKDLLPQTDLEFGSGGISFIAPSALAGEQKHYQGPDWNKNWVVVATDTINGDPIFIDQSKVELPVFTAMHGEGAWEPAPVADSWKQFVAALEFARPYTAGRENPVALEKAPLSAAEQQALANGLEVILGERLPYFWMLLFMQPEP